MTRRFLVVPGLFGSGLVLVAAAAVLWIRTGPSDEPQTKAPAAAVATVAVAATPTTAPTPTTPSTATAAPTQIEALASTKTARGPYEEGKALFLAKGCISCHWHKQAGVSASQSYRVGPDLSDIESVPYDGMPNDADFLRNWLKDPQAVKPGTQMPNLGLSDGEIESLLAFLLTDERG